MFKCQCSWWSRVRSKWPGPGFWTRLWLRLASVKIGAYKAGSADGWLTSDKCKMCDAPGLWSTRAFRALVRMSSRWFAPRNPEAIPWSMFGHAAIRGLWIGQVFPFWSEHFSIFRVMTELVIWREYWTCPPKSLVQYDTTRSDAFKACLSVALVGQKMVFDLSMGTSSRSRTLASSSYNIHFGRPVHTRLWFQGYPRMSIARTMALALAATCLWWHLSVASPPH